MKVLSYLRVMRRGCTPDAARDQTPDSTVSLGFADAPPLTEGLEPRSAHAGFDGLALERFASFLVRAFFLTGAPARLLVVLTFGRQISALCLPLLLDSRS